MDDPDLGVAALDVDTVGGGGEAGGSGLGAILEDWPDDDEGEVAPRHQPKVGQPGASSCAGLAGQSGTKKHRAGPSSLGGQSKKFKGAAAATRREEAAAKANRFRR